MARVGKAVPSIYTVGKETPRRVRNLDNLTQDVLDAEAKGYGCHYGRYKAAHPNTKAKRESAAIRAAAEACYKTCPECGVRFYSSNPRRIFCGADCQYDATKKRERARKKKEREAAKHAAE